MKTRRRKNRAKANWLGRSVTKKMSKEGADRERTGKPPPWARCGASQGRYECKKEPGHSKKHRDGAYEWHDDRPYAARLLVEIDALNLKVQGRLIQVDVTRSGAPQAIGGPAETRRLRRAYLGVGGVWLIVESEFTRVPGTFGGVHLQIGEGPIWAALLHCAGVPRAPGATSVSGV